MTARRKLRKKLRSPITQSQKRLRWKYVVLGTISLFILSFFGLLFSQSRWNGATKVTVVFQKEDGDVAVAVFDPSHKELILVSIPGTTEVSVSKDLGTLRLKSIWQLAQNKKLNEGKLLADTVTKNFSIPIYFWTDEIGAGIASTSLVEGVKSAFNMRKTNIALVDRLRLALFASGLDNSSHVRVPLEKTDYLKRTTLIDGEEGFVTTAYRPQQVLAYFVEDEASNRNLKVLMEDAGGGGEVGPVSDILATMGMKVAAVSKVDKRDVNCIVSGRQEVLVDKIAHLFSCSKTSNLSEDADVRLLLGTEFPKNF